MSIRKYIQSDQNKILEIYAQSKIDELKFEKNEFELLPLVKDEKRFTQLIESDIYVYVENEVVAYCAHFGSEIRGLFVHPSSRRKGIGYKLFEFILSKILDSAFLYVAASNQPAINLYKKYGFEMIEEFLTSYNNVKVKVVKMEQLISHSQTKL